MKTRDLLVRVGRAVRTHRKNTGLTINRLAEMASVDSGFLSYIENGTKAPSLPTLGNLADALGLSLSELLQEVPKSKPGPEEELIHHLRHLMRARSKGQREDIIFVLKRLGDPERVQAFRTLIAGERKKRAASSR